MKTRKAHVSRKAQAKSQKKNRKNARETPRKFDSGASVINLVGKKKPQQVPIDLIDEEGMESFPASDPPGHHRSHASDEPEPRRPVEGDF